MRHVSWGSPISMVLRRCTQPHERALSGTWPDLTRPFWTAGGVKCRARWLQSLYTRSAPLWRPCSSGDKAVLWMAHPPAHRAAPSGRTPERPEHLTDTCEQEARTDAGTRDWNFTCRASSSVGRDPAFESARDVSLRPASRRFVTSGRHRHARIMQPTGVLNGARASAHRWNPCCSFHSALRGGSCRSTRAQ